jgi:hypothetical protein
MIRTTLFHIALLLAPAVLYFIYLVIARKARLGKNETAKTLLALPWPWLLGAGIVLMAASLVVLSLSSGDDRGGTYIPPHLEDGKVVPGKVEQK